MGNPSHFQGAVKELMFPYKLTVSYDGTLYFGWQKTRSGPSIQGNLEAALCRLGEKASLPEAASRTDRGVHARGQIVAFSLSKEWEPDRLLAGLNALLPPDIRVAEAAKADPSFHPTLDAREKEYRYEVSLGSVYLPQNRLYAWHYPYPIDRKAMEEAARLLERSGDFSAFTTIRPKNPFCALRSVSFLWEGEDFLRIVLRGDRFLYRMARALAGTLLYVGSGKLSIQAVEPLFLEKKRAEAGMTAPAHGLFLQEVRFG